MERDILKEMFPYEASTPTGIRYLDGLNGKWIYSRELSVPQHNIVVALFSESSGSFVNTLLPLGCCGSPPWKLNHSKSVLSSRSITCNSFKEEMETGFDRTWHQIQGLIRVWRAPCH